MRRTNNKIAPITAAFIIGTMPNEANKVTRGITIIENHQYCSYLR